MALISLDSYVEGISVYDLAAALDAFDLLVDFLRGFGAPTAPQYLLSCL
jgi:hypothetical protein